MSDQSQHDEWFDEICGGPLGAWDLEFSLWAIGDVFRVLFAERDKKVEEVQAAAVDDNDDTGSWYVDRAQSLAFMEVACSHAGVGAVAPLAETLFQRVAVKLREKYPKPSVSVHHRANLEDEDFWNPSRLAKRSGGWEKNILAGFRQLLKALGLIDKIPSGCWPPIEALFEYRNAALHEGYEWPVDRRQTFLETAQERRWDWFNKTTDDGQPWLISAKDTYWPEAIKQIEAIAKAMRDACR